MTRRLRTLAALLALWALSLSVTGSAWAAACGGDPPAGAEHTAAAAHGHAHHGAPAPVETDRPDPSGERQAPACPLMAPGAAGACLGIFLSAAPAARAVSSDRESHAFPSPAPTRGLLDPAPPFHPPEA